MAIKKCFLIVACLSISTIAAGYGLNPHWFAEVFIGVTALDSNLAHILRAVMGLYIGLGLFWFISAFRPERQNTALLTVIFCCAGLLAGRLFSIAVDGPPSALLQIYTVLEAVLIPITYWVFRLPTEQQAAVTAEAHNRHAVEARH